MNPSKFEQLGVVFTNVQRIANGIFITLQAIWMDLKSISLIELSKKIYSAHDLLLYYAALYNVLVRMRSAFLELRKKNFNLIIYKCQQNARTNTLKLTLGTVLFQRVFNWKSNRPTGLAHLNGIEITLVTDGISKRFQVSYIVDELNFYYFIWIILIWIWQLAKSNPINIDFIDE